MAKLTYLAPVTRYSEPNTTDAYNTVIYSVDNNGINTLNSGSSDVIAAANINPGVSDGGGTFATLSGGLYFIRVKTHNDLTQAPTPGVAADWAVSGFYTVKLHPSDTIPVKVDFPNSEGVNDLHYVNTPNGEHVISISRENVLSSPRINIYKHNGLDVNGVPLFIHQVGGNITPTFKPYAIDSFTLNNVIYVVIGGDVGGLTGIVSLYTLDTTSTTSVLSLLQTININAPVRDVKLVDPSSSSEVFLAVNNGFSNSTGFIKAKGKLYKWTGVGFNDIPIFETEDLGGGWGVETFEIDGETYLLYSGFGYHTTPNIYNSYFDMTVQYPDAHALSFLYKYDANWMTTGAAVPLVKIQTFDSIAYRHFTFVPGDTTDTGFLFISAKQYRTDELRGEAFLLKWNQSNSNFESFTSVERRGIINSYSHQITVNDGILDSDVENCTNVTVPVVDQDICSTASIPFTVQFNYDTATEVLQIREFIKGAKFNLIICNRSGVNVTIDIRLDTGVDPVYLNKSVVINANETFTSVGLIATGSIKLFVISDTAGLSITCNGYGY